jgi:hypothetical protein
MAMPINLIVGLQLNIFSLLMSKLILKPPDNLKISPRFFIQLTVIISYLSWLITLKVPGVLK